jgi:hypothetical protein
LFTAVLCGGRVGGGGLGGPPAAMCERSREW